MKKSVGSYTPTLRRNCGKTFAVGQKVCLCVSVRATKKFIYSKNRESNKCAQSCIGFKPNTRPAEAKPPLCFRPTGELSTISVALPLVVCFYRNKGEECVCFWPRLLAIRVESTLDNDTTDRFA